MIKTCENCGNDCCVEPLKPGMSCFHWEEQYFPPGNALTALVRVFATGFVVGGILMCLYTVLGKG